MLFRVDPSSGVGLADQIAAQIRGALVAGTLVAGARLPAARQVAMGLDVNMHTVLRAYQTLRDEGLIDLRRGRGAVVRADVDTSALAVQGAIDTVAADALKGGWSADRAVDALRRAMLRLTQPPASDARDTDGTPHIEEGNQR